MKRSQSPKNRTAERAKEEKLYSKRGPAWLLDHPLCGACQVIDPEKKESRPTTQRHHMAGRNHGLINLEQYWLPVCTECHEWVTSHGRWARGLGLTIDLPVELGLKTR